MKTNSQRMAQEAYQRVIQRKPTKEFTSFAREFPTLVHSCGLAQAVSFALAKKDGHQEDYVSDLASVLHVGGHTDITSYGQLDEKIRSAPVTTYLRLSRDALLAVVWLKRYVEAMGQEPVPPGGK